MAMYPNATHGYMPFVKPTHKRQAAKKTKCDKSSLKNKASAHAATDMKTYKVTLRDRNGFTYTYIIQADTTSSKSMPVLCESRIAAPRHLGLSSSVPNMTTPSPSSSPESSRRHALLAQGKEDLTKVDDGEKKGLFRSLISFIMKKTGSSKSSSKQQVAMKSKRKTKPMFPKKRQRTISTISNLDPIQESPEEDDDFDGDSDSYTHDSGSVSGVDSASDNEGSES